MTRDQPPLNAKRPTDDRWCSLVLIAAPALALVDGPDGWSTVVDAGFLEGGFCYNIAREKFEATPTFH